MATADQIKLLIQSHFDQDDERFKTIVLQVAAYEAQKGHKAFARDIRDIVDKSKKANSSKIIPFNKDLSDMILSDVVDSRLTDLVVADEIRNRIERIIKERINREKLKKHGLTNRRKLLIAGPPGTGKTLTASVLAGELNLPFCTIMVDKLITKFMGETSVKLRQIFDTIREIQGVYLFDEFDAIGTERSMDNDVGEMRRVLNSFLQFIEQDNSSSLIIAATNNPKMLDQALFRRFDDVLHYKLPDDGQILRLIMNRLAEFSSEKLDLNRVVSEAITLSQAEISKACDDSIKETILSDKSFVETEHLVQMLQERKDAYT
ncbi:AAA family ATPase [Paenibacillus turicensis]|uniref:AAA family ATPase n=1 Tax=Paenibacillus turicensis TaxID=160487 RepID=UPI003D2C4C74